MKCPHCGTAIHLWEDSCELSTEHERIGDPIVSLAVGFCPECDKPIINMEYGHIIAYYPDHSNQWSKESQELIYPLGGQASQLDESIPQQYADQYYESSRVMPISPKASATLSRYLLQLVLHEELHIQERDLNEELKELEEQQLVSAKLSKMLHVFRKIANFGAHPKKSTNTGEIVEVAKGEAEIMLDLLEELFDCIFVKPKQQEQFLADAKEKYGIEV